MSRVIIQHKRSNQHNQLDHDNEACKNRSIHIKNEIKYHLRRESQHAMRIIKQNNQHIKISEIYNNDKIIGVKVNRMGIPQEESGIIR